MFISGPLILLLLLLAILVVSNGYHTVKSKCKHISGVVTAIYEDGAKDAVFKIAGQNSVFYIDRGFDKTLSLSDLSEKLKGKEVNILYADNSTALGSIGECRSISELSTGEEMVYSEFQEK